MAQIVGGGPPVTESERRAIAHLRDRAPTEWLVLHNVEVPHRGEDPEIDLIVITPHAVHLIDVKGVHGRVTVSGSEWLPEGRASYGSPVRKLRRHARMVKGLLCDKDSRLSRLYVDALVVLTSYDVTLVDPDDRDTPHVVHLDELIEVLSDVGRVPGRFTPDTTAHRASILQALHGIVRLPTGPPRFGNWEVVEKLGGTEEVTEYRAVNTTARAVSEKVLLRVYHADPFLPPDERRAQQRKIENAYAALCRMPPHPCIIGRRDFFALEDESRFVLVLDDVHGRALQLHLSSPQLVLSTDAKLRIILDMLRGLAHAHAHKVVHRALTPAAVLVLESGGALLTGFDYARPDGPREYTVSGELAAHLDERYVAPECQGRPSAMSPASDVYAAGIIAYRLLTGELPFTSSSDQAAKKGALPAEELAAAGVQPALAELLTSMCDPEPSRRPAACDALQRLRRIVSGPVPRPRPVPDAEGRPDYWNLPENYRLTPKYTVRRKLGRGTFGAVYQVYDDFASADRAVKIVLKDRESVVERLKQEYQILVNLPPHPNVVKVEAADYLNATDIPYLAFEYVEGHSVAELIKQRRLGPADAVKLAMDVARGLAFLHGRGIYHCDIKPSNLIWTDRGCKIIDFNVAVSSEQSLSRAGGTPRYQPPDATSPASTADLVDRDLYALGVTFYQVLTGEYPWDASQPQPGRAPIDPRRRSGINDLSDALVSVVTKAISPHRSERFTSAEQMLIALEAIGDVRRPAPEPTPLPEPTPSEANVNPFVAHLQTLYSQSTRSNAGTRGLHQRSPFPIYVETGLDRHLLPELLAGRHRLVIITGNAGDGKTAFLETLFHQAKERGADSITVRTNGVDFRLQGRWFHTNHDGSQDEGELANDDVLIDFFAPYGGADEATWPQDETRLIAINQGRLTDFLRTHAARFPRLAELVEADGPSGGAVTVVNLNQRSVVTDLDSKSESVLDRMIQRMTHARMWEGCSGCDLAGTCYALHNARTFAHPTAGPQVRARLRELFSLVHLRGRLHLTLRDVGSALAYLLTSGRDCAQIHRLYAEGTAQEILDGFYFNSWLGPKDGRDRLLSELRQVDVAATADPALDRRLDYVGPDGGQALITVDQRGNYDEVLLKQVFQELPRTPAPTPAQLAAHRGYLAAARRRFYFECLDSERAVAMLPYRSARRFGELLRRGRDEAATSAFDAELAGIIEAINRSEGLLGPSALGDVMALQIRQVRHGTIRSYRLFQRRHLSLTAEGGSSSPYVEGDPDTLILQYQGPAGQRARLRIRLDLFEMLDRLRRGHLPGAAELQGLYLGLTIFKNELAATPYHEVLLTVTGRDLHRVRRGEEGRLVMERITMGEDGADGAQR